MSTHTTLPAGANDVVLQTRALTMRFGGVVAVGGVDFSLRRKELRCLIGPNGAGKSTFFRCLSGQFTPTSGQVWLRGEQVTGLSMHAIARRGVGIKTQVPQLMNGLSVQENLWLAARRFHPAAQAHERAQAMLARLELTDIAHRNTGELAHGQRQMTELGIVLVADPWLVLLDEPAGGLTQPEVQRMARAVREANQTATVVVVEHDMRFIRAIASSVTVFHQGQILAEGQADAVLADERVKNVYLGKKPR
jgi:ABC-type uncharacterized transport system ATPase subunit